MLKWLGGTAIALAMSASAMAQTYPIYPTPGTASTIVTGGTAVTAIATPATGCYIVNPLTLTDQGIGTAEPLYVNPAVAATVAGNGSTIALAPGQTFTCPSASQLPVSVNAATSGHKFTVVRW